MKTTFEKIVYVLVYMPIALLAIIITDIIFYFINKFQTGWKAKF
jgi:ABC-type multidrug transport system permease subunit